jgi:hypothetical protein
MLPICFSKENAIIVITVILLFKINMGEKIWMICFAKLVKQGNVDNLLF